MSSLLAFDTATEHMSIAVTRGDSCWVHDGVGGPRASMALIPAINRLLDQAGLRLADLDAIGFGQGPGAFTGLRTACSVAQGLAFGAGKPVLCLDTLQVVAQDARFLAGVNDVWVVMDARMNEIYAAHYLSDASATGSAEAWKVLQAPALYALDTLNQRFSLDEPQALAGTAIDAFGAGLVAPGARRVASALPRAQALAAVARAQWAAGHAVDAALALPLYVRDKVALTTAERDAVKLAKAAAQADAANVGAVAATSAPRR